MTISPQIYGKFAIAFLVACGGEIASNVAASDSATTDLDASTGAELDVDASVNAGLTDCVDLGPGQCACAPSVGPATSSACSVASVTAASSSNVGLCCFNPSAGTCDCITFSCTVGRSNGGGEICECSAGVGEGTPLDACTNDAGPSGACCFSPSENTCTCDSDPDYCKANMGKVVKQCDVSVLSQTCAVNFPDEPVAVTACQAE